MASIHKGVAAGILFLFLFGFVQAEKGDHSLKCKHVRALGMESYGVPDHHLNWSSAWNSYENGRFGRLNRKQNDRGWVHAGGWVAKKDPKPGKEWLEVQFPEVPVIVTGVATQGRHGRYKNWVTKYKLAYFDFSANKMVYYREKGHKEDKEFAGNKDQNTIVRYDFKSPFRTNATRFVVLAWHNHPSMRVEVYGCKDVNECFNSTLNTCGENTNCINLPGDRYDCECKSGFSSTESGKTNGMKLKCKDNDECENTNPCGEHSTCVNIPGSYTCDCAPGYELTYGEQSGNVSCQGVDECKDPSLNTCGEHTNCINNPGGYDCECKSGYTPTESGKPNGMDLQCKDVDECKNADLNECAEHTICINQPGSYNCKCAPGFKPTGNEDNVIKTRCKDINECEKTPCHPQAKCKNTAGSYSCKCNPGLKGDGKRKCRRPQPQPITGSAISLQYPVMLFATGLLGCLALF